MTAPNSPIFDIQNLSLKFYNNTFRKSIDLVKMSYYESLFQNIMMILMVHGKL